MEYLLTLTCLQVPSDSGATPYAGHTLLDDNDRVRYVSSAFWSHIDEQLDILKGTTSGYQDDEHDSNFQRAQSQSLPPAEADLATVDRHAFLLKHAASPANHETSTLFPMASQIPYLLEVYSERVHFVMGLPHMPSLKKTLQSRRNRQSDLSPGEEALMFSVFYAAICSLDEDEVTASFNSSRSELMLKYRKGLEQALAAADFLNNPTGTLVQAFVIFLGLARRDDSPRYTWMMVGLVVRMAHYLGIHHDGASSKHLTPFQVELQRRVWWNICALDMRATEDQGTDLAAPHGSFSTKLPSNINEADIWPEMNEPPSERQGPTSTSLLRLCSKVSRTTQEMIAAGATATADEQVHRLTKLTEEVEREYFNLTDQHHDQAYLAAAGFVRIALSRLTILAFVPILCPSPSVSFSSELHIGLLVAAIDVLEHNHALNSDPSCHPWKWIYQTQQHWHAVVYLLIGICRRPWSSTIERAWVALHSPWLVPARARTDSNFSVLVPLKRLMARARKHREDELTRLRGDQQAAASLEREDRQQTPAPSSSATFPAGFDDESFRQRWRQLVQATTPGMFSSTNSTPSDTHSDAVPGSSARATNVYDMLPPTHNDPVRMPFTLDSGIASLEPPLWQGGAADLVDPMILNSSSGPDVQMNYADFMDDDEFLNFDWNSWLGEAKDAW